MKIAVFLTAMMLSATAGAQESKPVLKDSVRVFIPGCSKGYIFTAGPRTEEHPGSLTVPEGMHLRMNLPKQTMAEIKRQEGSRIEISGIVRKDQLVQDGVRVGPGRITGGPSPSSGGPLPSPVSNQVVIDVEGWHSIPGDCPR